MAAVQSYGSWGLAGAGEAFAVQLLCCASDFFPPLLAQHPLIALFIFFFLKSFPFSAAVAKFSLESRRGDEPSLNQARGGWGCRSFACPRLPRDPERFSRPLQGAVRIFYEPSVHLGQFYFLFCCNLHLCQGQVKPCLDGMRS